MTVNCENLPQRIVMLTTTEKLNPSTNMDKAVPSVSGPTSCLIVFFKYLKYFWMVPYKIEYSPKSSSYRVSTNRGLTIIFWTFPIIGTLYHVAEVLMDSKYDTSVRSVIRYTLAFSLTCWTDIVLIQLWLKRRAFAKLMTSLQDISNELEIRDSVSLKRGCGKTLVSLLSIGCVLMAVAEVVFFFLRLHQHDRYTKLFEVTMEQTKQFQQFVPGLKSSIHGKLFLGVLGWIHVAINYIYFFSIGHFGYAFLLVFCVVTGNLYKTLNTSLPKQFLSLEEMHQTIDLYNTIRSFTTDVNNTVGTIMAWGILSHLPYNAFKINDLLNGGLLVQLSYLIHIIMYLGILVTGANVHSQITIFMDKLACDSLTVQDAAMQTRVGLMLQQSRMAGLRGGGGMFLLTYGFLGNIIGVILTYAILTVQFQHP